MKGLIGPLIIVMNIATVISVSGCADPYVECMKEEKKRNAYLGEDEYFQQSSKICASSPSQSQ